ncbi:MAG: cell division protein FtsB [Candidatus Competibacter sp.]|nr:cell division protein FtsB [Candidatus Competibacter sp.]
MQILIAVLIAALGTLQYLLWIDEDGLRQSYALRVSVQAQTEENAALNERNRALEADIQDLKTGLTAIEERARSEMGMIRQDETFYRLLEKPEPDAPLESKLIAKPK